MSAFGMLRLYTLFQSLDGLSVKLEDKELLNQL